MREISMKKKFVLSALIFISVLITTVLSAAENSAETKERRFTFSGGYDGNYMHYEETYKGEFLDKDTGWLNGFFTEFRYDNQNIFARINYQYGYTDSATYDGSLQDGTPYSASTPEEYGQIELNSGLKAIKFTSSTASLYAGFGYRDWLRGQNVSPDYLEEYSWYYGEIGINWALKYNSWIFALDAAVQHTINPKMETGGVSFDIKSRPGYRIQLPVNYFLSDFDLDKIFIFTTPYFQRWNIGASDVVYIGSNGYMEPDSYTNIYGIRLGMGINF